MKAEQVSEDSRFEAELSNELGNEGFALLAHDVRSSMFGLLGSLELIEDEGLPAETRDRLRRARTSGALLNDLLKLVFGDIGVRDVDTPLNVADEVALLIERWYDQAQHVGLNFKQNISSSVRTINVIDRTDFHRIFNNLIGNSIKHSKRGHISIDADSRDGNAIISITDTGSGFSDSAMGMLFEFRGRPEDSPHDGSGLGLYISEMLVREVGGTIAVENIDGGGARVTVSLPMSTMSSQPKSAPHKEELPDLSHLNILLAEDNVTNQLVVTQMLKSMGANFQVASDGVETLALFERDDFDAVLLDIEMPRKSGLEVLREIRARKDAKSGVPMIALTAYVMHEHREKIDAAGADGLISKPIAGIAPLGHQILEYVHGVSTSRENAVGTSTTPLGENTGYVDREIYDVLAGTIGPDFLSEFLEKVVLDFESIKKGLAKAEANADYVEWRNQSHILISVAGAVGATMLQSLAQELNAAAKAVDLRLAKPLNSKCIQGISTVVTFLNNEKTG